LERQTAVSGRGALPDVMNREQSLRLLPLLGMVGDNPASCRATNAPTPEISSLIIKCLTRFMTIDNENEKNLAAQQTMKNIIAINNLISIIILLVAEILICFEAKG
jgi:hypothetical protein